MRWLLRGLFLTWTMAFMGHASNSADQWITNQAQFPNGVVLSALPRDSFPDLHAETIAGNFKILCTIPSNAPVTLYASADPSGHWPARNWQAYPMAQHGREFQVTVPVTDLDVPLAYFLSVGPSCSAVRLCHPRELGMTEATGHFWTFLEGFEQGLASWYLLSPSGSIQQSAVAKSGRAAMLVKLPAEKHSVTIATTLLRGWQLKQHAALGIRLWVRTEGGAARARMGVIGNAFTHGQCVQIWPETTTLGPSWQKVDLYFDDLPTLDLAAMDLFTIEFIGQGPCGFLVDDVEILAKE